MGAVIVFVMFTGLFVYVALLRRSSHLKGRPFRSKSPMTTAIWTWVGKHSIGAIAIACALCLAISVPLTLRFARDKLLLDHGEYDRWTGEVTQYTTQAVSRRGSTRFANVSGQPPTWHEHDQLTVEGRTFSVQCDLPPERRPGVVGGIGQCLRLQAGRHVEVDYVQISPTTYRSEPLRIQLIEP